MSTLYENVGELVVTRCWCGIQLAIPRSLSREMDKNPEQQCYCPLGHTFTTPATAFVHAAGDARERTK